MANITLTQLELLSPSTALLKASLLIASESLEAKKSVVGKAIQYRGSTTTVTGVSGESLSVKNEAGEMKKVPITKSILKQLENKK